MNRHLERMSPSGNIWQLLLFICILEDVAINLKWSKWNVKWNSSKFSEHLVHCMLTTNHIQLTRVSGPFLTMDQNNCWTSKLDALCVCVSLPYASKKRAKQKAYIKKKPKWKITYMPIKFCHDGKGRGGVQGLMMMMPSLRLGAIPFGMHKWTRI